jgi:hypothetical protein
MSLTVTRTYVHHKKYTKANGEHIIYEDFVAYTQPVKGKRLLIEDIAELKDMAQRLPQGLSFAAFLETLRQQFPKAISKSFARNIYNSEYIELVPCITAGLSRVDDNCR